MSTLTAVASPSGAREGTSDCIPLDIALEVANIGLWSCHPTTKVMSCDLRSQALCGLSDPTETIDRFVARICPDDRARVQNAFAEAATSGNPLHTEFRIASTGVQSERWVLIEGCRYLADRSQLRLAGTMRDVSTQKYAEAEHEVVLQEMEHRIRNVFTVIGGVVSLSEGSVDTPGELARALRRRIGALDRAYTSLSNAGGRSCASLRQIVETELAAFADLSVARISGPPVLLNRERAITMHLIAHELTTNALKYGALSRRGGHIDIRWQIDASRLVLHWEEGGTPAPDRQCNTGFGSRMMSLCARLSLGGDMMCDYRPEGARVTLVVPIARLWQS